MADVLESSLEGFFYRRVQMVGGATHKLAPIDKGMPDRLVVMPGGRMYLVELKRPGGELSPAQKLWHARHRAMGGRVYVVTGKEGILNFLRHVINPGESKPGPKRRRKQPTPSAELAS